MVMSKQLKFFVMVLVMAAATAATAVADGNGIGASASYSMILATHSKRTSLPIGPEVYGRFFNILEAGIFGTYGSGQANQYKGYRSVIAGAEVRIAPAAKFYMPYAGLGISYAYHDYEVIIPDDHSVAGYISIAPLRFTLKPLFNYQAEIHPTVSLLQIRFGPFYYDGGNPSRYDIGNFIAAIDLIRVGVYFGL